MHRTLKATAAVLALAAILPAAASAVDYPPPAKPQAQDKPKGPFKTLTVCTKKKKGCSFTKINDAVKKAKPGDTIKVADGTYKEGVIIKGKSKRFIKLVGNTKNPLKVRLEGKSLSGEQAQNGVQINGANQVTVDGFSARNYVGNGFFVVNATGYTFNHLNAQNVGTYGIYAFNTLGGAMLNSEASYNNDAGFYIGQTPPQAKPLRTTVKNVKSWGNVLGWSGTNMKYVTISKSFFYNNGTGIVPNVLASEKFQPASDNVITDNDVFWNNFNYYRGTIPFKLRGASTGGVPYPMGVGILLFGSQNTTVSNNRIYGNYAIGFGALKQLLLETNTDIVPDSWKLIDNRVQDNQFGNGGKNPNGRGIFFDGSGTGNCFSGNTGVESTLPEDGSTLAACPFTGANTFNEAALGTAVGFALSIDPKTPLTGESSWIKKTQAPVSIDGKPVTPLEHGTE